MHQTSSDHPAEGVPDEDSEQRGGVNARIAIDATLVICGAMLLIGSFQPWTRATIGYNGDPFPFTVYRSGFQLGPGNGFSVAGVITAVLGVLAVIDGSLGLAERSRPQVSRNVPWLAGIGGILVGTFGMAEAAWYRGQIVGGYPTIFGAGMGFGIPLILCGGSVLLAAWVFLLPGRDLRWRLAAALAILVAVSVVSFALAPT